MVRSLLFYWGILLDALFFALLIWISSSDIKSRKIPNAGICLLIVLGLLKLSVTVLSGQSWCPHALGFLTGMPFLYLWLKKQMGAGDVKLIMASSWYLGLGYSLLSLVALLIILSAVALMRCYLGKPTHERLPLAPFVSMANIAALAAQRFIPGMTAAGL